MGPYCGSSKHRAATGLKPPLLPTNLRVNLTNTIKNELPSQTGGSGLSILSQSVCADNDCGYRSANRASASGDVTAANQLALTVPTSRSTVIMMRGRLRGSSCNQASFHLANEVRIDTSGGSREINNRLRDIETMLGFQSDALNALAQNYRASSLTESSPQSHPPNRLSNVQSMDWAAAESLPPLTIPVKHRTSSSYLLTLPAIKSLIGENPPDLFFRLESQNPVPEALSLPNLPMGALPPAVLDLRRSEADELVGNFFATAHANHPLLDETEFQGVYEHFMRVGPDSSIECALCMVVLSLGAAASSPRSPRVADAPPGMKYMQHALPTLLSLSSWSFSTSLLLPQALVLASLYFAYIVRPLQSWRLIQTASSNLQLKLSQMDVDTETARSKETVIRLFWSCFLIESDRLAELELPRSGLQELTDSISLPNCTNLDISQSTCYLAEIAVRRLLNRIHNSLYPSKRQQHFLAISTTSLESPDDLTLDGVSSIMSVCDELHLQLETWHSSIPETYRPALDGTSSHEFDDREAILRIRYYAARHIIWRPFVIYVATHGMQNAPEAIYEKAALCLSSCRSYIQHTTMVLRRPSLYTWTFSMS